MVIPLMGFKKNDIIGLLYLTSPQKYFFDKKDIIHLKGLAELITMPIIQLLMV